MTFGCSREPFLNKILQIPHWHSNLKTSLTFCWGCKHIFCLSYTMIRCTSAAALWHHTLPRTPQDPSVDIQHHKTYVEWRENSHGPKWRAGLHYLHLWLSSFSCSLLRLAFVLFMLMYLCLYGVILMTLQLNNQRVCLQEPTQHTRTARIYSDLRRR